MRLVLHVDDFRLTAGEPLEDVAEVFIWPIDGERFHRLEQRILKRGRRKSLRFFTFLHPMPMRYANMLNVCSSSSVF